MKILFLILFLTGLSTACDNSRSVKSIPSASPATGVVSIQSVEMEDWVIKTYETEPDAGQSSVKALNKLLAAKPLLSYLHDGETNFSKVSYIIPGQGRAWLAGNGLVALNASPEIHGGVPDLIEKIASSKARQQAQVRTEIWYLHAIKSSFKGDLPPDLEKAVESFRKARPGYCLVETDHLFVPSIEGHEFNVSSHHLKVKGYTMKREDTMMASIEVSGANRLQSMVKGKSGETIVVLESKIGAKKVRGESLKPCGFDKKSIGDVHTIIAVKLTSEG